MNAPLLREEGVFAGNLAGQGLQSGVHFSISGPDAVDIEGATHYLDGHEVKLLQKVLACPDQLVQLASPEEQNALTILEHLGLVACSSDDNHQEGGSQVRLSGLCSSDTRPHLLHDTPRVSGGRTIEQMRTELFTSGFVISSLEELQVPDVLLDFKSIFDDPDILKVCEGDRPPDRKRARVVVACDNPSDAQDGWRLRQYPKNGIAQKSGENIRQRPAEYPTFKLSQYPRVCQYLGRLAGLMFEKGKQGTLGLNCFETFSRSGDIEGTSSGRVVEKPHQDHRDIIAMLCTGIKGDGGARNYLYRIRNGLYDTTPAVAATLREGEILVILDGVFAHDAGMIRDASARRMVVTTRNHDNEYPLFRMGATPAFRVRMGTGCSSTDS